MVVRNEINAARDLLLSMTEVSPVADDAAGSQSSPAETEQGDAAERVVSSGHALSPHSAAALDSPLKQSVPRGFIPPALQGCLRCDACSCIYLDEIDYYKHVRNYHSASAQKRLKRSSSCRTCVFSKIEPEQVNTLKGLQQHRAVAPIKINVLQNNVKTRWSRMFGSRLRGQMTPLSAGLRAIDPARVPLKAKVKMQAGLQPFVVQELDAKMSAMKRQRAAADGAAIASDRDAAYTSGAVSEGGAATPPAATDEAECAAAATSGQCSAGVGSESARVAGPGPGGDTLGQTVAIKQEPLDADEAVCAALLHQVEVRIKTEPDS